jgi:hypothetical protein
MMAAVQCTLQARTTFGKLENRISMTASLSLPVPFHKYQYTLISIYIDALQSITDAYHTISSSILFISNACLIYSFYRCNHFDRWPFATVETFSGQTNQTPDG